MGRAASVASLALVLSATGVAQQQADTVNISVDTRVGIHAINPLIYGVNSGTTQQLQALRAPVNRSGGNSAETYNQDTNARSSASDWFFESTLAASDILQQYGSNFATLSNAGGARTMLTIPLVGWVAKLGPNNTSLASFNTSKYGPQQSTDSGGFVQAGNGVTLAGKFIVNDPNDAMQPESIDHQAAVIAQYVSKFRPAIAGGVYYYLLGNEPGLWHETHRDVHPVGTHASELASKTIAYGNMIHAVDPTAKVVAPEDWAPVDTTDSGFDLQIDETQNGATPDRITQTGGLDLLPWLLKQWRSAGKPIDVVSVHYYPQGGEYGDDVSESMQLLRNKSTRGLWDPNYHDISWIPTNTALIPKLRAEVDADYIPGTPIAITEYSWGADTSMSGATTQADIFGIFGRENLDIANRWIAPPDGSPTFLAMKLFRNYDDMGGSFGDTSVSAVAPDVDTVSAFAAIRSTDKALTVMLVNKQLSAAASAVVTLGGFAAAGSVETMTLSNGTLTALPEQSYARGAVSTSLPPQSVTLLVLHAQGGRGFFLNRASPMN